jgi:hypothetical protein
MEKSTIVRDMMYVRDLRGQDLDYWVARSLHDFVQEIYFTDSGDTLAIKGVDKGRAWDGRFFPSRSWENASIVLERTRELQLTEDADGLARCVAAFHGSDGSFEATGETATVALLRAFIKSRFGDAVEEVLRGPQALTGIEAAAIETPSAGSGSPEPATPAGEIGDIKAVPRP